MAQAKDFGKGGGFGPNDSLNVEADDRTAGGSGSPNSVPTPSNMPADFNVDAQAQPSIEKILASAGKDMSGKGAPDSPPSPSDPD